jgi:hypothetical protein
VHADWQRGSSAAVLPGVGTLERESFFSFFFLQAKKKKGETKIVLSPKLMN